MWHTDDSLSKLICNKFGMAHKKDVSKNYMLQNISNEMCVFVAKAKECSSDMEEEFAAYNV